MIKYEEERGGHIENSRLLDDSAANSFGLVSSNSWCGEQAKAQEGFINPSLSKWEAEEDSSLLWGKNGAPDGRGIPTWNSNHRQTRNQKQRQNGSRCDRPISQYIERPSVDVLLGLGKVPSNGVSAGTKNPSQILELKDFTTELVSTTSTTSSSSNVVVVPRRIKKQVSICDSEGSRSSNHYVNPLVSLQETPVKSSLKHTKEDILIDFSEILSSEQSGLAVTSSEKSSIAITSNPLNFLDNPEEADESESSDELIELSLSSKEIEKMRQSVHHKSATCCWGEKIDSEQESDSANTPLSTTVEDLEMRSGVSRTDQAFTGFLIVAIVLSVIYLFWSQNLPSADGHH